MKTSTKSNASDNSQPERMKSKKIGKNSGSGRMKRQRRKVAQNLLKGMSDVAAVKEAGYSDETANCHSKKVIQHPEVQSILTRSLDRVLEKHRLKFDAIMEPHVKALKATIVARTKYGAQATRLPDHVVRMAAAEHLQSLHRAKDPEHDRREGSGGGHIAFTINFIEGVSQPAGPVIISPPAQASENKGVPALLQRTEPGQAGHRNAGGGVVVVAPPVPASEIRSSPGILSADSPPKPLNPNGNGQIKPQAEFLYPGVTFLHGGA